MWKTEGVADMTRRERGNHAPIRPRRKGKLPKCESVRKDWRNPRGFWLGRRSADRGSPRERKARHPDPVGKRFGTLWDGRGRFLDNIFVERLWHSVKYECVFLHEWLGPRKAERGLRNYFHFYNQICTHSSLDKVLPAAVYFRTPHNPSPERCRCPVPILLRPESGGEH